MRKGELLNTTARRVNPPALHKDPSVREKAIADVMRYPTVGIVTGGIAAGIGQTLAYKAAADGTLPTIMVGKRRQVVSSKLREMLGLSSQAAA